MPPRRSSVPWPVSSQHFWGCPVFQPSHEPPHAHVVFLSQMPHSSAARLVNAL